MADIDYRLEPVKEHHVPALADIMNYYILNTTVSFFSVPLSVPEMREKVFFDQSFYQAFALSIAGEVTGYCAVSQWKKQQAYRHTAEINIYLKQAYTAKGIGTMLLQHAERFAKENDLRTLIAGLCSENVPSRKLFEKNDYHLCADFQRVGYKFGRELGVVYLQKFL